MKENESKNRMPKEHELEGPEAKEVRGTVVQYLLDPRGEVEDCFCVRQHTSEKFVCGGLVRLQNCVTQARQSPGGSRRVYRC